MSRQHSITAALRHPIETASLPASTERTVTQFKSTRNTVTPIETAAPPRKWCIMASAILNWNAVQVSLHQLPNPCHLEALKKPDHSVEIMLHLLLVLSRRRLVGGKMKSLLLTLTGKKLCGRGQTWIPKAKKHGETAGFRFACVAARNSAFHER